MVQELLRTVTRNLNQLPARDGISDCLSLMMLVTGIGEIDYNKLTLEFGSYVQVHESNERTNDQQPRTFGAIAMSMTRNASGHHNFLNLNTGKLVQRRCYTDLPITQSVIERVKQLAISTGQPPMVQDGLLFEWGESDPITDDDPDDDVDIHNDTDATGSPERGYHPVTDDDLTIDYPEQHADNALEDGSSVSLDGSEGNEEPINPWEILEEAEHQEPVVSDSDVDDRAHESDSDVDDRAHESAHMTTDNDEDLHDDVSQNRSDEHLDDDMSRNRSETANNHFPPDADVPTTRDYSTTQDADYTDSQDNQSKPSGEEDDHESTTSLADRSDSPATHRGHGMTLRSERGRSYAHRFINQTDGSQDNEETQLIQMTPQRRKKSYERHLEPCDQDQDGPTKRYAHISLPRSSR